MRLFRAAAVMTVGAASWALAAADDPYLWLEEIESERALAWVAKQNEATAQRLTARPDYAALQRDALEVLNAKSRLPAVEPHGGYLYNFWQDESHPRGLYRRTTPEELRKEEPQWETVLDVDALAAARCPTRAARRCCSAWRG